MISVFSATIQAILPAPLHYWETQGAQIGRILLQSDHVGRHLQPREHEWSAHSSEPTSSDNNNGCLPPRLGSTLRGLQDRRSVVRGGEIPPHQLSRVIGGLPGSQVLLQRQARRNSPSETGQFICNSRRGHQPSARLR